MFSTTQDGANASAYPYSLIEAAKGNQIYPFLYLLLICKELPKAVGVDDYARLIPHAVQKYFKVQAYQPFR